MRCGPLVLLLFLFGSGMRSAHAEGPTAHAFVLKGVWHGQFPANEGDEGVDIDFDRNRAFFLLDGKRVQRQDLRVEQSESSFSIWLTSLSDAKDQAVITGRFVDPGTLRGRYANKLRAEDFEMDLIAQP